LRFFLGISTFVLHFLHSQWPSAVELCGGAGVAPRHSPRKLESYRYEDEEVYS
jgi:hypothetical protein